MKKGTKFFVNDKIVHMDGDLRTIMQSCEKIGLFIPRFCYSESLSIAGNCRMCLVEIEKSPKLMPACAISIAPDMKIHTKTNLVKLTRESILEFLLINHPLDCPICDQGGECDLQDQAMIHGSDRGRFHEYKRSVEDKNAGPLIKTIMTRCIHCTRCIRFATEIAGVEVYGCSGRGKKMEVGTYISNLFGSELSGNVIDLCPVGALTAKAYAFSGRPWELKSVETIDVFDCIGKTVRVDVRGSELMRILPSNGEWITDKTRFSYDGLKCQRLNYPMIKDNNQFISVSWKKALTCVADRLSKADPRNISAVIGQFVDQESILILKDLISVLGASQTSIQHPFATLGLDLDCRYKYLPKLSREETKLVLLVGSNPRFEASSFNIRLRVLATHVVSIGFPTDLTYRKNHFGNGTKALLSLALGKHALVRKIMNDGVTIVLGASNAGREDGDSLTSILNSIRRIYSRRCHSLSENKNSRQSIAQLDGRDRVGNDIAIGATLRSNSTKAIWRWRRHRTQSDFSEKSNMNILHAYASTPGACELGFPLGSNHFSNINSLQIATDLEKSLRMSSASATSLRDLDEISVSFFARQRPSPSKQENGDLHNVFFDSQPLRSSFHRTWHVASPSGLRESSRSNKCLYLLGADSVVRTPAAFTIYQGHHGDIGAKSADVILPSTAYTEKNGTYTNVFHRVQHTKAVIQHGRLARDDWKIIKALLARVAASSDASGCNDPLLCELESIPATLQDRNSNSQHASRQDTACLPETGTSGGCVSLAAATREGSSDIQSTLDHFVAVLFHRTWYVASPSGLRTAQIWNTNSAGCYALFETEESFASKSFPSFATSSVFYEQKTSQRMFIFNSVRNSNFVPPFDNFYLSDVIGKSSILMGKCSARDHNFI